MLVRKGVYRGSSLLTGILFVAHTRSEGYSLMMVWPNRDGREAVRGYWAAIGRTAFQL